MIPLAAPDEAMLLKDLDDGFGDLVAVSVASFVPSPVGRVFDMDVDGRAKRVDGEALGTCDLAPFEGAPYGREVFFVTRMRFEQFF